MEANSNGSNGTAGDRWARFAEGSRRRWWVNLGAIVAARLMVETIRGYDGQAAENQTLRMYLPCTTPIGEAMSVTAYGAEALAIAERLDRIITRAADIEGSKDGVPHQPHGGGVRVEVREHEGRANGCDART